MTGPLIKVLHALLGYAGEIYGFELLRSTGLRSGTLYPLLDRLEKAGWVTARWEDDTSGPRRGPRRRFYRLTELGRREARQSLGDLGVA